MMGENPGVVKVRLFKMIEHLKDEYGRLKATILEENLTEMLYLQTLINTRITEAHGMLERINVTNRSIMDLSTQYYELNTYVGAYWDLFKLIVNIVEKHRRPSAPATVGVTPQTTERGVKQGIVKNKSKNTKSVKLVIPNQDISGDEYSSQESDYESDSDEEDI